MPKDSDDLGPGTAALLVGACALGLLEILGGLALAATYSPQTATAHASAARLHAGGWRFFQAFHYWNSSFLILFSGVLVLILVWQGKVNLQFRLLSSSAVLLFVASLTGQVTGNLLPFDRHGVQTANIETGIAARVPLIGASARNLALGGPTLSQTTLSLCNGLHWLGGAGLLIASVGGLAAAMRARASVWVSGLCMLPPFVLAGVVASPLGSGAGPDDYGAYGARVSWYTWPLHGSLVMLDKIHLGLGWVGAVAIPGFVVVALFALPWVSHRIPLGLTRGLTVAVCAFYLVAAVFFGGAFAPLTGTRDPVAATISQGSSTAPLDAKLIQQGRELFAQSGCVDCHGADGNPGGAGPSLKSEGLHHADEGFFERYVHNPPDVDPQSTMPAFPNLKQQELRALAEFLRSKRG